MLELMPNTLPCDSVHVVDRHSRVTVVPRPSAELTVFYTHIQVTHVATLHHSQAGVVRCVIVVTYCRAVLTENGFIKNIYVFFFLTIKNKKPNNSRLILE
jgi:hypothetical protein